MLPFTNIRKDPQTDFLGFALADQIIGSLSYLENILVRPSSAIRKAEQFGFTDSEQWYNYANIYGLLGDESGCIRLLKKAVDGGFFCYPFLLSDSFLDSVRDNPEFQIVLEKAKGKHEAFREKFFPDKN